LALRRLETGCAPGRFPTLSERGRFIAYQSFRDLTDNPGCELGSGFIRVYLYDSENGSTTCVSAWAGGDEGQSVSPVVTSNGHFVVFISQAQLMPDVRQGAWYAYRWRRASASLTR
jgi:Tol biopolymer transport system component